MRRNAPETSAPGRDDVRGISTEIARAAARHLLAREERLPPEELPPIRSPVGELGPGRWTAVVRASRAAVFDWLHRGRAGAGWPRVPPREIEALGRRVAREIAAADALRRPHAAIAM